MSLSYPLSCTPLRGAPLRFRFVISQTGARLPIRGSSGAGDRIRTCDISRLQGERSRPLMPLRQILALRSANRPLNPSYSPSVFAYWLTYRIISSRALLPAHYRKDYSQKGREEEVYPSFYRHP